MTKWLPPLPPEPFDQVVKRKRNECVHRIGQALNDCSILLLVGGWAGLLLGYSKLTIAAAVVGSIVLRLVALELFDKARR